MLTRRRVVTWGAAVLAAGVTWAVLFVPVGTPRPLAHIEATLGPSPQSGIRVANFELTQSRPELGISLSTDLRGRGVTVGLDDANGKLLCNAGWYSGKDRRVFGFSPPNGFAPGRYRLRVMENQALGRYAVEVLPARPKGIGMSRFVALMGAWLLVIGGLFVRSRILARRGRVQPQSAVLKRAAQWVLTGVVVAIAYVLAHEAGHALAMTAFGLGVDFSRSDFLGLHGQPGVMAGSTSREHLAAWQDATISLAGDALPTALAYLLFALWISGPGKRLRSRWRLVDEIWSWLVGAFLFAHFGWVLAATGLVADADYMGLIRSVGDARALANVAIVAVGVVNAMIIYIVARHLRDIMRAWVAEQKAAVKDQAPPTASPRV